MYLFIYILPDPTSLNGHMLGRSQSGHHWSPGIMWWPNIQIDISEMVNPLSIPISSPFNAHCSPVYVFRRRVKQDQIQVGYCTLNHLDHLELLQFSIASIRTWSIIGWFGGTSILGNLSLKKPPYTAPSPCQTQVWGRLLQ